MAALTAGDFLKETASRLRSLTATPELDAACILAAVLDCSTTSLVAYPEQALDADQEIRAKALVTRRGKGEPVAYLLGSREFYSRDFEVSPAVLIPRPDTELLIETALEEVPSPAFFADLGTGSGCILATLLAERESWRGAGVDRSRGALAVARRNCGRHGVLPRALLVEGDFTRPLCRPSSLDLVAANPPYIGAREYETLMRDVRDYEPKSALVPNMPDTASDDGFACYAPLEATARLCLRKDGFLIMEMGASQGPPMLRLFARQSDFWEDVRIVRDLGGRDRLLVAKRSGSGV